MNSKTKGLLIFAFGGVLIVGIMMGLFDVPHVDHSQAYQVEGIRIFSLIGVFVGFLCIGYGFTLLRENKT